MYGKLESLYLRRWRTWKYPNKFDWGMPNWCEESLNLANIVCVWFLFLWESRPTLCTQWTFCCWPCPVKLFWCVLSLQEMQVILLERLCFCFIVHLLFWHNFWFLFFRRTLFCGSNILSHLVGNGALSFGHKKSSNLTGKNGSHCVCYVTVCIAEITSLFVSWPSSSIPRWS